MIFASALSTRPDLRDAAAEAAEPIRARLGGPPDLVLAFVTPHHQDLYEHLPDLLGREVGGALVGCSGGGVVAEGREAERGPALALIAGRMPGVQVIPFHLPWSEVPDVDAPEEWHEHLGVGPGESPQLILLPDPFTCDSVAVLAALDAAWPEAPKIGGLASGGQQAGHNALFAGGELHRDGICGVALLGDVRLDTVVAQGCRPVGPPLFATRVRDNVIQELDGQTPGSIIEDIWRSVPPADRALLRSSVALGVAMRDEQRYDRGDFLVRNVLGLDRDSGALVVGARVEKNQVVQLHVRDAATSSADLDALMAAHEVAQVSRPAAALLFSCLGRGEGLYGVPDHDSATIRRHTGQVPMGGFFCNGEIGPVQGRTWLHGYTAAVGLLRPRV